MCIAQSLTLTRLQRDQKSMRSAVRLRGSWPDSKVLSSISYLFAGLWRICITGRAFHVFSTLFHLHAALTKRKELKKTGTFGVVYCAERRRDVQCAHTNHG